MNVSRFPWLRWLVWAAAADWLLARTLARSAIFMPKSPPVLAVYRALTLLGQVAGVLASLLALLGVLWLAWAAFKRRLFALSLVLTGLAGLSLLFLISPPAGWLHFLYQALLLTAVAVLGRQAWASASAQTRLAVAVPWAALLAGGLYQAVQALALAGRAAATPPWALLLFNAGELFAVLTPIALWWAFGRQRSCRSDYLWALLPAVGFAGMYMAVPSMAGILSIWSTGLTLYLPWPVYALALWLGGVTLLACRREGHPAGSALLLLAAGGYTPGLSTQAFLGLLALELLDSKKVVAEGAQAKVSTRLPSPILGGGQG